MKVMKVMKSMMHEMIMKHEEHPPISMAIF